MKITDLKKLKWYDGFGDKPFYLVQNGEVFFTNGYMAIIARTKTFAGVQEADGVYTIADNLPLPRKYDECVEMRKMVDEDIIAVGEPKSLDVILSGKERQSVKFKRNQAEDYVDLSLSEHPLWIKLFYLDWLDGRCYEPSVREWAKKINSKQRGILIEDKNMKVIILGC